MFEIGDFVVYPIQGVARVIDIEDEMVGQLKRPCYILESLGGAGKKPKIKLPFDRVESNLVRKVVSADEAQKVLDFLKVRQAKVDGKNWQKRLRDYKEKMESGEILQAAEVLKELSLIKQEKTLSMTEIKIFDQARNLVIKELSIATRQDEETIESEIFVETAPPSDDDEASNK